MPYSKVVYNGKTLIDLTGDTVTPETLSKGITAHQADGTEIVGTMESSYDSVLAPQIDTIYADGEEREDLLPKRTTTHNNGNVDFIPVDGGYKISATSTTSSTAGYLLYRGSLPAGMEIGQTYVVETTEAYNIYVQVLYYKANSDASINLTPEGVFSRAEVTIPDDCDRVAFYIYAKKGFIGTYIVYPRLYAKTPTSCATISFKSLESKYEEYLGDPAYVLVIKEGALPQSPTDGIAVQFNADGTLVQA